MRALRAEQCVATQRRTLNPPSIKTIRPLIPTSQFWGYRKYAESFLLAAL